MLLGLNHGRICSVLVENLEPFCSYFGQMAVFSGPLKLNQFRQHRLKVFLAEAIQIKSERCEVTSRNKSNRGSF